MKLLKKISLYFFIISLIVFLLSSIVSFFVLKNLVLEEVNETLRAEKNSLVTQLKYSNNSQNIFKNHSYSLEISPIAKDKKIAEQLNDTLIYVRDEEEGVQFRQLKASAIINGNNYLIVLRRSLIEKDDLITGMTVMLIVIFFLIITALNLINYYGEKRWWKPFYETLQKLSEFRINQNETIHFKESKIDEFNELNQELYKMTEKLQIDYRNLKEFSENASHEMQTPLAIIRSKLDLMIQDKSLNEKQFDAIRSLYDAVSRLGKLNQSLNLLTKIENEEFEKNDNVNISQLIDKQLNNLDELISLNSLKIRVEMEKSVIVHINSFIAETLITNILINSIKHNVKDGKIIIELKDGKLIVANSGNPPKMQTEQLFQRFKKEAQTSDSPGLGLSIVKKICELNGFIIDYNFIDGLHIIRVSFNA